MTPLPGLRQNFPATPPELPYINAHNANGGGGNSGILVNEATHTLSGSAGTTYYFFTSGVRIYCRNFDADDPSADVAPIDTNDTATVKTGDDTTAASTERPRHGPAYSQSPLLIRRIHLPVKLSQTLVSQVCRA